MRTTLLALLLAATACKSDEAPKVSASASTAVAGTVVDVKGTVSVAGKPLAKGDTVTADSMIDTGADSSVTILLAHNDVKLELGANKHVRVNESIAWKAPKRVEPGAGPDDSTESAGRPAERSAAETSITATENAPADTKKDVAVPQTAVGAPADKAERKEETATAPPPKGAKQKTAAPGGASTDDFGQGGLGIRGTGAGGGGTGDGIGLGGIGTIGHGGGTGEGQGFGAGKGSHGGGGNAKVPKVTQGTAQVSGSLPAQVIQRIVRSRMSQIRYCYEKGLAKNPELAGKINVKFTIAKDGSVASAGDAGSTLPDTDVIACAVSAFLRMSFPSPEGGGVVNVTYPILFAPSK